MALAETGMESGEAGSSAQAGEEKSNSTECHLLMCRGS